MKNKAKIQVYCGESVSNMINISTEIHPVKQVENANSLIESVVNFKKIRKVYSNSPDFVSAIKYIGEIKGLETEFFLNGTSQGNDIEKIFEDFNKSYDLLNNILGIEK